MFHAVAEGAAWGRVDRAGHVAVEENPVAGCGGVGDRIRGEQGLGVGMARVLVDSLRGGQFHDFPQVHDRYLITHVLDHGQVVRNEQITQSEVAL